jgi:thiol peroxidase
MTNNGHLAPAIFTDTFEPVSDYHLQMVGSHIHWMDKLRHSIVNKETPLNIETISKDDCCAFGKWLHDERTRSHLGHFHRYQECVEKHAEFHSEAGKVAKLANKGEYDNALHALDGDSNFSRAAIALIATIFPVAPNPFFSDSYWKTKLHLPMQTNGSLPIIGNRTPDFFLANSELENVNLASYSGKRKILAILPSFHVPGGLVLTRKFTQNIASLENTVVLVISADLPFIQRCFFETEVLNDDVVVLSTFRTPTFATDYGVQIINGVLAGLMAPAVIVVDAKNKVIYTQLLSKLAQEPNYEAITEALTNSDSEEVVLDLVEEDVSEHSKIPNVGASGDALREHFRVDIPMKAPCYCEIVLPAPKENATTEYNHAYAQATHKIQNKMDEMLRQQEAAKTVVQNKGSSNCMRLHLHDISATGCSIVNYDAEFSYFLQPNILYRDCMIFIPHDGVVIANFKVMSKHKVEHHIVGGSHELVGIRFVNMPQSVEFVVSSYVQELERQRISILRE